MLEEISGTSASYTSLAKTERKHTRVKKEITIRDLHGLIRKDIM